MAGKWFVSVGIVFTLVGTIVGIAKRATGNKVVRQASLTKVTTQARKPSDIVLARPNLLSSQAMPLGNGRLGVAVWSEAGLTAQLNRVDTLPDRVPVAKLTIPGLSPLTTASDYAGRLALYDAEFHEQAAESAPLFM